jgi:hypothetical protein
MMEVYMLQPVTASCDLFATQNRCKLTAEPDLAELMRDPMTQALMAADRVDHGELHALLSQVRENLR